MNEKTGKPQYCKLPKRHKWAFLKTTPQGDIYECMVCGVTDNADK